MRKLILFAAAIVLMARCGEDEKVKDKFRTTGEFEQHESVWMGWATYENKAEWISEDLQAEMIKTMIPDVIIDLCINDDQPEAEVRAYLVAHGITEAQIASNIRFHVIDHSDLWFRDWSGVWMVDDDGHRMLATMNFNSWGYDKYWGVSENADDHIDEDIAEAMGADMRHLNMIMEAGNLEFNGKGTLICVEQSLKQRNPELTTTEMVKRLKNTFNLGKIIVLPHSVGNDAHTVEGSPYMVDVDNDGTEEKVYTTITVEHSDEFVRWVAADKVLLSETPTAEEAAENPITARTREAILAAREILENSTTADGKSIQIVDFPEVGNIYWEVTPDDDIWWAIAEMDFSLAGKDNIDTESNPEPFYVVMAASYANFVVTNNVVIVSKYGDIDPAYIQKDALAKQRLEEVFPGRTVFQMDPRAINIGGGGMHCITMNMPAIGN